MDKNETVLDAARNLMWSRAPLSIGSKSFANAEAACAACRLGEHTDWRMPTLEELQSLVDYTRYNPAIDTTRFPATPARFFWSSSPDASDPDYAWIVNFYYGNVNLNHRRGHAFVRAVRSVDKSS